MENKLFGSLEAGGTKFVCAVGTSPEHIEDQIEFPTTDDPQATTQHVVDFFIKHEQSLQAIGIGSFGPLNLDPTHAEYGAIAATPKPGWSGFPLKQSIEKHFNVPVFIDTDVNAAALAEGKWGNAQGLHSFVYITIGTGIGGGVVVKNELLYGINHPEVGHIQIRQPAGDTFEGICPYHGNCLEGLACGPAIQQKWGTPAETLPDDHPAWQQQAAYIARGLQSLFMVLMPQRFILGGGVMQKTVLYPLIRQKFLENIGGYFDFKKHGYDLASYIQAPGIEKYAGLMGGFLIAQRD